MNNPDSAPAPFGDCGFLLRMKSAEDATAAARAMRETAPTGVDEVFAAYDQVMVAFRPEAVKAARDRMPWEVVAEWMRNAATRGGHGTDAPTPRSWVVPVCYGGTDLDEAAAILGMTPQDLAGRHREADYTVAAVGFSPGFPYLAGLPAELALARKDTPSLRVEAGSVGIGGAQTGIYPQASPGGWWILGRTALRMFDPNRDPPALFAAGDRVCFEELAMMPETECVGEADVAPANGPPVFKVIEPGMLDSIQDGGRRGMARFGVSGGGVMDPWSAMIANLSAGNPPEAATLEMTYVGPVLRVLSAGVIALGGAAAGGLPPGMPHAVRRGETIDLRSLSCGARSWLALGGGGFSAPIALGSRATHLGGGFGGPHGRALRAGDFLFGADATAGHKPVRIATPRPPDTRNPLIVCLVPSADWPGDGKAASALRARVENAEYHISDASNRMGIRLSGDALPAFADPPAFSRPVLPGVVQLPPDGRPIILHVECQTIGGYPCLGHVATPDLGRIARALPGTPVRFRVVGIDHARAACLRRATAAARMSYGAGAG